ncbi:MAG: AAA family ATPase [Ferrimicrobium sp.]|uniref:AAA family ATPase n=1 Tax=Ferrimicrobium sp. TaxID=2926050 RepID=UPI002607015C|nr:AAA family ATPase [Ferrimicrobium sp.]
MDAGLEDYHTAIEAVLREMNQVIHGKDQVVSLVVSSVIAGGHVLLEDVPGVAKTLIARSLASVLGMEFARIQFTPDLLPSDIIGMNVWDPENRQMNFKKGPVFTNVLLADELNRASPKTQSALLEAMAESQVTVDGTTYALPDPFVVIATQNPIEFEGTYPLPEAQVDRFLASTTVGYPSEADERRVVLDHLATGTANTAASRILDRGQLIQARTTLERIYLSEPIVDYIVALTRFTRERASVSLGASPRGSIALALLARASAAVAGRDFVAPQDVKAMATPALGHRIRLSPEAWIRGIRRESIVREAILSVPAPVGIDAD